MNVPLYAAALVVFAVLYLGLSVFLLLALAATLLVMMIVLALQVRRLGARRRLLPTPPGPDSRGDKPVADARRSSLYDQAISLAFIGATWGIFVSIAPHTAQLLGPGLTYPSPGPGAVAPAERYGLVAGIGGLAVAVGGLWYRYAVDTAAINAPRFRPILREPVPPGITVSCEFLAVYRFAVSDAAPESYDTPNEHAGAMEYLTLLGRSGSLPQRFPICRRHIAVFARVDLLDRTVLARP